MLAVDTNLVVRYLKDDDVQQSPTARAVIESADVLVSLTVLLETEWVLRRGYGYDRHQIATVLRVLASEPRIHLESPDRVGRALTWLEEGLDFADALHVAGAGACEAFVTFDHDLVRRAGRIAPGLVRHPPEL